MPIRLTRYFKNLYSSVQKWMFHSDTRRYDVFWLVRICWWCRRYYWRIWDDFKHGWINCDVKRRPLAIGQTAGERPLMTRLDHSAIARTRSSPSRCRWHDSHDFFPRTFHVHDHQIGFDNQFFITTNDVVCGRIFLLIGLQLKICRQS